MKRNGSGLLLAGLLLVSANAAIAQQGLELHGTVRDAKSGDALPAVSIGLKHGRQGTITDDSGRFSLSIDGTALGDSVRFSFIGHGMRTLAVKDMLDKDNAILLTRQSILLSEAVVRPLRPEDYIRLAVRRIPQNHATGPVIATGYYYELMTENGQFLRFDEAVTASYIPGMPDTVKGHSSILHARSAKDVTSLQFMQKTNARKQKKADRRGKEYEPIFDSTLTTDGFGGPSEILGKDPVRDLPDFLDTTQFKHIRYTVEGVAVHAGRQLLVIGFDQRRKIDHATAKGRIYIDADSYAFVAFEYEGRIVIPLLLRPVISMAAGLSIGNPTFQVRVHYREHEGIWHVGSAHQDIRLKMSTTALFQKNEHCDLFIEQAFVVNDLQVDGATPIAKAERYDSNRPMTAQARSKDPKFWDTFTPIRPKKLSTFGN
ncbi:MAG: carboxypeptidase-like regulatory domain-containing protein [Flavobacteriales bacterium]|nr:carboxypeptidase-like regulatory domain-containing protein [Flavobacteriales bacterium]